VRLPDDEPELYAIKVNMTMDPELYRRAIAAEVESKLLRAALDAKHAGYEDLRRHSINSSVEIDRLHQLLRRMLEAPATHVRESWKDAIRQALVAPDNS
jgi:hypothetical protein